MRSLRTRMGWTLKQMSAQSGIPMSTLSKVEHDRLTLNYEKLQQISLRLKIPMSDLFGENLGENDSVTGRRSISNLERSVRIESDGCDDHYLFADLRRKQMVPILKRIRPRRAADPAPLVRHEGEEFLYVIDGSITVRSEFYDALTLHAGEGIYLDASMGHSYVIAEGCTEAVVIGACWSPDDKFVDGLMAISRAARASSPEGGAQ